MFDIVIVVGETSEDVEAIAAQYDLAIVSPIERFSGLDTYSVPNMTKVGVIRTNRPGFIALARPS